MKTKPPEQPSAEPPSAQPLKRLTRLHRSGILRMTPWLAAAVALYFLTFDFGLQESHPGLQATIYNFANITVRAYLGYWVSRHALGRLKLDGSDPPLFVVARALLMGLVIVTSR